MRRKSLNLLTFILCTAFILLFFVGCGSSSSSSSSSKSKSNSNTKQVDVNISSDSTGKPVSATVQSPAVTQLPTNNIEADSSAKSNAVNKITLKTIDANTTLAPAVTVYSDDELRKAVINSLSKGENISVNLQGKFTINNIGDKVMKIIETSGYSGYISGIQFGTKNNVAYIVVDYKNGTASYLSKINIVDAKVQAIVGSIIRADMTDYEKELTIHDYLVDNVNYDYNNYVKNTLPADSFTAYGALINGTAVCEGYTEAMYKLLNAAKLKALIVTGTADGVPHAWNMVNLSGGYYHVDATFDDPPSTTLKILTHNYFNVNDSQISKDHSWTRSDFPASNAIAANFFVVNDLVASNVSKYYQIVKDQITKKNKIINIRTNTYDPKSYNSDIVYKILKENTNINYVDTTKGIGFDYDKSSNVITILVNYL